eukprot:TRINITY_DN1460_c0_g1_i1.p1 TRINITY_DN1460_c0_g1~~TRINITY_DN1460_c0_g1_i1.p1  ORF type:complete len:148 (+),score=26.55 TRINITY_DN1460_c0_g1_i1:50-493(+)
MVKKSASVSKSTRAGLVFPVGRIGTALKKGRYATRIGSNAAVFLTAVLESCTTELMELSQSVAATAGKRTIKPRHISLAVREDADLSELLSKVTIAQGGVRPSIHPAVAEKSKTKSSRKKPSNVFKGKKVKKLKKSSPKKKTNPKKK